jgi:ketosteroid isomerase-like protein
MMTVEGRYVTIWMKGEDGAWKCALDIWNNAPPPAEG